MIDLFTSYESNLLPNDGAVYYYGPVTPGADKYLETLLNEVPWKPDQVFVQGQIRNTRRKVAWYGDRRFAYAYSGVTRQALPWIPALAELKELVEKKCGQSFNSCLLNLYADGTEGMAWHSDDEAALGENTTIASLSLGAERRFLLRHKVTKQTLEVNLQHGSLLVMKGATQTNWLHSIPAAARVLRPRVNLTFRTIVGQEVAL